MTSSTVSNAKASTRTLYMEKMVAELLGLPLIRENVFHSAKYFDGNNDKEVCDVLLMHRGQAIVVSIKAQDKERDQTATARWLKKNGTKAIAQLGGAYRTLSYHAIWCEHGILGKKYFQAGEITPRHGVVLLESKFEMLVNVEPDQIDRLGSVVPITLMTIQDFINLAQHLRTWRDLEAYLNSRWGVLQEPDRRVIGAELPLLGYYTAMKDTFSGCRSIDDAKIVTAAGRHVRDGSAFRDRERILASMLEDFIAGITIAGPVDLPPENEGLRQCFRISKEAKDIVRDDFCDLTIQERAMLGEQISYLSMRVAESQEPDAAMYATVRSERRPHTVYVVLIARDWDHGEASFEAMDVTLAACAHFRRPTGVFLLGNQVGSELRFSIGRVENVEPTLEYIEAGEEDFGQTRPRKIEVLR